METKGINMAKTMRSTFEEELHTGKMSKRKTCCRYLVAFFVFLNDVADFVSDWLFFADVDNMKPGLVYGPPANGVWVAILVFSSIGTFLFCVETINLYYETVRHNAWVDSDILSLLVVWVEDVPQVIISLSLVLCREEAISMFQLVKASVILFGIVIRLIQVWTKYFNRNVKKHIHHKKMKIIIVIGMLFEMVAAILVFVLSYTAPNDSGIFFQVPTTLIEEKVDDTKYFTNVSVFVNHPEYFDVSGLKSAQNWRNSGDRDRLVVNWMRLDSINLIMVDGKGEGIRYSLEYETNPSQGIFKLAWWKKTKAKDATLLTWTPFGCYIINQTAGTITKENTSTDCTRSTGFFTGNSSNAYITFGYTPPGTFFKGQLFGDITFNMRVERTEKGVPTCQKVDRYSSSLTATPDPNAPLRFHYFQTASEIPALGPSHFFTDTESNGKNLRFFRNDGKDLTEIGEVWKTGWLSCKSQGHLAPTINEDLKISCSRN